MFYQNIEIYCCLVVYFICLNSTTIQEKHVLSPHHHILGIPQTLHPPYHRELPTGAHHLQTVVVIVSHQEAALCVHTTQVWVVQIPRCLALPPPPAHQLPL